MLMLFQSILIGICHFPKMEEEEYKTEEIIKKNMCKIVLLKLS